MVATLLVWGWANRDSGYPPEPITPESIARAEEDMRPRGSFEDALARGDQLFAVLQNVIGGLEPGIQFHPRITGEITDCGGSYGAAGGRESKYRSSDGTPTLASDNWREVNDRSIAAAAEAGIELVPIREDDPVWLNQVALETPDGGFEITIFNTSHDHADGERTVIAMVVKCHLPADKLNSPVKPTK
ncbi:LppA family lipoprotein [Nocardia sp. AG03]|uniref:LppA family lipoprotein n=1 Tax=Nocardia sp. AG03 TaxID=3025312 RepID=UPI00241884FB|nr:LppA family lipoprotein [Nocardia sp. AG03]